MIPDSALNEAYKPIIDLGLAGSIIIFLMVALGWVILQWMGERKDHKKTANDFLEYAKSMAALGVDMKNVSGANAQALQANAQAILKLEDTLDGFGEVCRRIDENVKRLERAA